jgi:hypothetical protein
VVTAVTGTKRKPDGIVLTPEQSRRRRARSIALALVLAGFAFLFYLVTIVKFAPGLSPS